MTAAETDRLETFLHAADERGLQFAVETIHRMGMDAADPAVPCRREFRRVARSLGMDPRQLLRKSKAPSLVRVRSLAIWQLRQLGYSYPVIGAALEMDHTAVRDAVMRVERDAGQVERGRNLLETWSGQEARAA